MDFVDQNSSASELSLLPTEISRVSQNRDGSSSPAPVSRSRASEANDLSLSFSVHGFETGDMVWGHAQSHPWWPGHIYNETFASSSVLRNKCHGHLLVAFFGDDSYGWFKPSDLLHFAPSFLEKSKQITSISFLRAVEDSIDETRRRAALGLCCMCRNPNNFRPMQVPGYFVVDVPGYELGALYSTKQIHKARDEFVPNESLTFLRQLALDRMNAKTRNVEWIKRVAVLLAFRKVTFEEYDETYVQAFTEQPEWPAQDNLDEKPEKFVPKGIVVPISKLGYKSVLNNFD